MPVEAHRTQHVRLDHVPHLQEPVAAARTHADADGLAGHDRQVLVQADHDAAVGEIARGAGDEAIVARPVELARLLVSHAGTPASLDGGYGNEGLERGGHAGLIGPAGRRLSGERSESPNRKGSPTLLRSPYPPPMPDSVVEAAPAKLNLALAVGPPESSGMHPISSWMVTIDLFDDLELVRLPEGSLSRYAIEWHPEARRRSEIDWSISKDLAVRAHLAIERLVGRALPIQMRLRKRIPVGGGLGGGSSDAAAAIRAVDRLFELDLDRDAKQRLAAELGSDVVFLLEGGSAIVEGLGDRIEPTPAMPELHAAILMPEFGCPTGAIYRRFDETAPVALDEARVRRLVAGPLAPDAPFNDLAAAAFCEHPQLADLATRASEIADRPVQLSGSGSSLFVLCDDPLHARALATATEDALGLPATAVSAIVRRD